MLDGIAQVNAVDGVLAAAVALAGWLGRRYIKTIEANQTEFKNHILTCTTKEVQEKVASAREEERLNAHREMSRLQQTHIDVNFETVHRRIDAVETTVKTRFDDFGHRLDDIKSVMEKSLENS